MIATCTHRCWYVIHSSAQPTGMPATVAATRSPDRRKLCPVVWFTNTTAIMITQ